MKKSSSKKLKYYYSKMKKRLDKKTLIKSFFLVIMPMFVIGLISGGLYFRNRVDNEEGKASEPTYSCAPDARYIDVSMCPTYTNYANNENANSAVFFNEIIRRAANARTNPSDEVVIRIPSASFYFFDDDNNPSTNNGYFDMHGGQIGSFPNFTITGHSQTDRPTLWDKDQDTTKNALFISHGNDNLKLNNVIFIGNNKNKYNSGLILVNNSGGVVSIDNVKCSGTYGDAPSEDTKGGACINVRVGPASPAKVPNFVEIKNSEIVDYHTGLVMNSHKKISIVNNEFDNKNPCVGCSNFHGDGNIAFVAYDINSSNLSDRSIISNNTFMQNGRSEGETALGLMGLSNRIDILNNTFSKIEDRVIYVSSHILAIDPPCLGGPKDIKIIGNTITGTGNISDGSTIEAISVVNQPTTAGCTGNIEKATVRDIIIANNNISGVKGGIELSATPHAPLHTLKVYNNTITNSGLVIPKWWFGDANLSGACMRILGLKGKNNDPNDIQIYNNNLNNCELGIYFMASWWPMSDDFSGWANYTTQNQKNEYISVYDNTIRNSGSLLFTPDVSPNKIDIVVQEQPVKGIGNRDTVVMRNNLITTDPKSTASDNRCNVTCTSNNECLGTVPTLYGNGTSIVSNYPVSYVCSSGKCRNSVNVNDNNCDLNDQNQSSTVASPTFSPAGGTYVSGQTVTINTQTQGATIRYTVDGTDPTESSVAYTVALNMTSTMTLKAKAYKTGMTPSATSSATYTINTGGGSTPPSGAVEDPTFVVAPIGNNNTFNTSAIIQLSTATSGATIRYTTNGSTPTSTNGTIYSSSSPITITTTTTIKAIAYKSGMTNSGVVSRTYTQSSGGTTQVANPTISPSATTFTSSVSVSISSTTSGATIRYTTNGTTPTSTSGTVYTVPFTLTNTSTVKAIAYKSGMTNSGVVSRTYTKSSSATSSLVIFAKGTIAMRDITPTSICTNGYPNMVVKYNNIQIGRRCLDSTYPSSGYSYTISTANADPKLVTIHFTNDYSVPGVEDRNMIIEKIVLNGTQTMLPSNLVYAMGQWTPTYGCGLDMERPATYSNRLGCNGYMRLRQL